MGQKNIPKLADENKTSARCLLRKLRSVTWLHQIRSHRPALPTGDGKRLMLGARFFWASAVPGGKSTRNSRPLAGGGTCRSRCGTYVTATPLAADAALITSFTATP